MKNFKQAYPVILTITKDGVLVEVPDLELHTKGKDFAEAIREARNLIGAIGLAYINANLKMPEPTIGEHIENAELICCGKSVLSFIDVNFEEYWLQAMTSERTSMKESFIPI